MDFIKGFDLSTLLEVERCGGKFYDGGEAEDCFAILRRYGGNWVRLRLWNDPYDENGVSYGAGGCDLPTLLALARRAKANGMRWLLCLHYSDFWADPGKQYPPKAWRDFNEDQMTQAVCDYTRQVLDACRMQDVMPDMVQVGNELTNGLLWPSGRRGNWDTIHRYVTAGVRAVRESAPKAKVMIHLDNGGNRPLYLEWFGRYFEQGGDCDVIGLSYYPFWHGTLADLKATMDDIAPRFGKELVVVETSMGFTMESYADYEQLTEENRKGAATRPEVAARSEYPMTVQGQVDFTEALLRVIEEVPEGKGRGFFWWEPAWLPVPGSGWAVRPGWEYVGEKGPGGNEWANQALFDYEGNALPALQVIREYRSCLASPEKR